MQLRTRLLGVALAFGFGCGDDSPYVPQDAGPDDQTFTKFVIDLVTNHTVDPDPVSYEAFKDLADPDGDNNNVNAYDGLFQ
jgi:hypothetical protein